MSSREKQVEIIKSLNDNRSKLSALFSLYNASILNAEENRNELGLCYDKMIDLKNDATTISSLILDAKKKDREELLLKNKSKIKKINDDMKLVKTDFVSNINKYDIALTECGNLKSEYKHSVSVLCKQFKDSVDAETEPVLIKGYKQQVKIIKAILDKIEALVSEYNVKRNIMSQETEKFDNLCASIDGIIGSIKKTA